MERFKSKIMMIFLIMLSLPFVYVEIVYAQQPVITATLKATPESYSGECPTTIRFEGEITVKNVTRPHLKVQYKFLRSDGAFEPVQALTFKKDCTEKVSTSWSIGKSYEGWEAIKVIYPQDAESNKASFKLICKEYAAAKPEITGYKETYGKKGADIRIKGNRIFLELNQSIKKAEIFSEGRKIGELGAGRNFDITDLLEKAKYGGLSFRVYGVEEATTQGTGGVALLEFTKDEIQTAVSNISGLGTSQTQAREIMERKVSERGDTSDTPVIREFSITPNH